MKTAEEIFNTIAFLDKNGDFFNMRREHIIEAMKEYAKQVAEQSLKYASDKSIEVIYEREKEYSTNQGLIIRNFHTCYATPKQSILQTEIKLP